MAKLDKSTIGEIGVRERSVNMDRSHFIEQSTKTWSAPTTISCRLEGYREKFGDGLRKAGLPE
jgi:hypothetical protein